MRLDSFVQSSNVRVLPPSLSHALHGEEEKRKMWRAPATLQIVPTLLSIHVIKHTERRRRLHFQRVGGVISRGG